jgi:hypothetical protein
MPIVHSLRPFLGTGYDVGTWGFTGGQQGRTADV